MDAVLPSQFVTSPSDFSDAPQYPPSPLALVQEDDPQVAEQAEHKLAQKTRLSRIFSLAKHRSSDQLASASNPDVSTALSTASISPRTAHSLSGQEPSALVLDTPINLDNSALAGEDIYTDRYEWAILYENQRGMTIFSIPYYSSLSLLPTDPSPFTLPGASLKRSEQPPISLESYPLPDGNWNWVSRCWMIDMRSDTGEVQHDGFEYNWMFRRHNWRAQIGSFNAGGWVRRRRWVRLMVRPAKQKADVLEGSGQLTAPSSKGSYANNIKKRRSRLSLGSTFPPSVNTQHTDYSGDWAHIHPDEVWVGECEQDWQRCRNLMKRFVRDGRKLELWKLWLGFYHPEHKEKFQEPEEPGKRRDRQWTEDDGPMPSEMFTADHLSREYVAIAPREHVIAVLRVHGQHILSIFVFPESRVQFLKLLAQAQLLPELNVELGVGFGSTEIDFWSYASGLGDTPGANELLKTSTSSASLSVKPTPSPASSDAVKNTESAPNVSTKGKFLELPSPR